MSTTTHHKTLRMTAVAGALALALAACGDSGTTTTAPPDTGGETTTTVTDTTEPTTTTGGATTTRSSATTATTTDDGGTTATSAPAPTTTGATQATAAPPDDALAAALAVREAPLEIELDDGTLIVFSEWFFATFNRDATVTVERDGTVVAEGTVVDPAVMEDRGADGFAFFGPNGDLVATLSQAELLDAANQALIDAGLAP